MQGDLDRLKRVGNWLRAFIKRVERASDEFRQEVIERGESALKDLAFIVRETARRQGKSADRAFRKFEEDIKRVSMRIMEGDEKAIPQLAVIVDRWRQSLQSAEATRELLSLASAIVTALGGALDHLSQLAVLDFHESISTKGEEAVKKVRIETLRAQLERSLASMIAETYARLVAEGHRKGWEDVGSIVLTVAFGISIKNLAGVALTLEPLKGAFPLFFTPFLRHLAFRSIPSNILESLEEEGTLEGDLVPGGGDWKPLAEYTIKKKTKEGCTWPERIGYRFGGLEKGLRNFKARMESKGIKLRIYPRREAVIRRLEEARLKVLKYLESKIPPIHFKGKKTVYRVIRAFLAHLRKGDYWGLKAALRVERLQELSEVIWKKAEKLRDPIRRRLRELLGAYGRSIRTPLYTVTPSRIEEKRQGTLFGMNIRVRIELPERAFRTHEVTAPSGIKVEEIADWRGKFAALHFGYILGGNPPRHFSFLTKRSIRDAIDFASGELRKSCGRYLEFIEKKFDRELRKGIRTMTSLMHRSLKMFRANVSDWIRTDDLGRRQIAEEAPGKSMEALRSYFEKELKIRLKRLWGKA